MSSDSPTEHQSPQPPEAQEMPETAPEASGSVSSPEENAPAAPQSSEADSPKSEAPAAPPDQPASAETETSEPAGKTEEAAPKRRVRLNPSGAAQLKAVPNVGGPTPATSTPSATPPAEPSAPQEDASSGQGDEQAGQQDASAPQAEAPSEPAPAAPRGPVEIPDSSELDAALEAEIEAAMQGDEEAAVSQASTAQVEGDENAEKAPAAPISEEDIEEGARLSGTVQSVAGENVFIDLGFRSPGVVQTRQFPEGKLPQIGETLKVIFDRYDADEGLIFARLAGGVQKVSGNWDAVEAGQIVDCMVSKTNKGGLEVRVGSLRGFMPAGQVDLRYVENLEPYVGKKLRAKILEADPRKRNLIVSRRALLEEEREALAADVWQTLEVGQERRGVVKTLKNYGAFVDLGGVDGFLHIGEISWQRLNHPSEVLSEGQNVDVKILSIDKEKNRIGLGMRQLSKSPWEEVAENFAVGSLVTGKVTRTADFGAFVELEPGVEGLVHISELEYRRVNKVTDVVKVGDEVEVKVLEVDPDRKRISLSIKQTQERAAPQQKAAESEPGLEESGGDQPPRKRPEDLKGGIGSTSGGLFGNPADYE